MTEMSEDVGTFEQSGPTSAADKLPNEGGDDDDEEEEDLDPVSFRCGVDDNI